MDLAEQRIRDIQQDLNPVLDLTNLGLEFMPIIPKHVEVLYLSFNKLAKLEKLPTALRELYVDNNLLMVLPDLPKSLEILSCQHNKMTQLPELPSTLSFLDCRYNFFEYEPTIHHECRTYYYPQEKDILEIVEGAEDFLASEEIQSGNILVDFDKEASFERYYKKETFDHLEEPKLNPVTRNPIQKTKTYIARLISAKKTKTRAGGGRRRTLKRKARL
jgi:hypothetical protein